MNMRFKKMIILPFTFSIIVVSISGCNLFENSPASSSPQSTMTSPYGMSISPTKSSLLTTLKDIVVNADAIVYGTTTDQRYEAAVPVKGDIGSVYTVFTLSVEKMIKGERQHPNAENSGLELKEKKKICWQQSYAAGG
jgi:hypothetical protein